MDATVEIDDPSRRGAFFGPADRNLRLVRAAFDVRITARDGLLRLSGTERAVQATAKCLRALQDYLRTRPTLTDDTVREAIANARSDADDTDNHVLSVYLSSARISPKGEGQARYVQAMLDHDLTFCLGPAGTGKTYLAVAVAVSLLRQGKIKRIVLVRPAVEAGERILVTTLTKRMSEDLSTYLRERKIRVEYLHSDIGAIERVEILRNLRRGDFDVLVGVNLLREGLDLPEVALVAILDADKEGFLRSFTSLIQTSGRAARHEKGRVLLYADVMTRSIERTLEIITYRREKQLAHNLEHGITPRGVKRAVQASLHYSDRSNEIDPVSVAEAQGDGDVAAVIAEMETEMIEAANDLQFERAAILRDQIDALKKGDFGGTKKSSTRGRKKYRPRKHSTRRR